MKEAATARLFIITSHKPFVVKKRNVSSTELYLCIYVLEDLLFKVLEKSTVADRAHNVLITVLIVKP